VPLYHSVLVFNETLSTGSRRPLWSQYND